MVRPRNGTHSYFFPIRVCHHELEVDGVNATLFGGMLRSVVAAAARIAPIAARSLSVLRTASVVPRTVPCQKRVLSGCVYAFVIALRAVFLSHCSTFCFPVVVFVFVFVFGCVCVCVRATCCGVHVTQACMALCSIQRAAKGDSEALLFHQRADSTIGAIQESIEAVAEASDKDTDVDFGDSVLKIKVDSVGTFVLNKQPPSREVWYSSPLSGPAHYVYDAQRGWYSKRDGHRLLDRVHEEFSKVFETEFRVKMPTE